MNKSESISTLESLGYQYLGDFAFETEGSVFVNWDSRQILAWDYHSGMVSMTEGEVPENVLSLEDLDFD